MSEGWDGDMQEHMINGARDVPMNNVLNKTEKVSPNDISYRLKIHSKFMSNNPRLLIEAAKEIDALRNERDSLKEELNSLKEDFNLAVDSLGCALMTADSLSAHLRSLKLEIETIEDERNHGGLGHDRS